MNRGIYTAATGMMAQQLRLDIAANNLANATTRAYKADKVTFGELVDRTMRSAAGEGGVIGRLGAGPDLTSQVVDFSQGSIELTGNPLDVALEGEGMMAVETRTGIRYTRDGVLGTNAQNQLITKSGDLVLDQNQRPIRLSTSAVEIAADGTIHEAGKKEVLATIGLFRGRFEKVGANLFEGAGVAPATVTDRPRLHSRAVEASNVEPVTAMVEMIAIQRAYEMNQKMAQSQDEATAKLSETIAA